MAVSRSSAPSVCSFFFFNDTATTEIYTLSLHDALPIFQFRGHSMECRINAENPETFARPPGRITGLNLPGGIGVRVDTAAYQDCVIPPYYDSLVAKLITYGRDRGEAISRMNRALGMFVVEGIHTSIPMQQRILRDPDFVAGASVHNVFYMCLLAPPSTPTLHSYTSSPSLA